MADRLDNALRRLRDEPPPAAYASIEQGVWARIDRARDARRATPSLYSLRAAAVVLALGAGMLAGGFGASRAGSGSEVSIFTAHSALAPSTLLDSRG